MIESEVQEELITVNVLLADRHYPLKIRKGEEEQLKEAIKMVTAQLKGFQDVYAGKDKQDYLAMCVLMLAVDKVKNQSKIIIDDSSFADKLQTLEEILSNTL